MDRKEIFFVLYFSACPDSLRLEMKPGWCFSIFLHLFLNFLIRVGFERIGRKFFLFSILQHVLTRFVLKWSLDDIFYFLKFFAFILEFSNSGRVRTDRNEIFFVPYFSTCPDPFCLEMKPGWCFLVFRIFLHLFLNFLTRVGFERMGRKFFLFSIFRPVLTRFVLKWSLDDIFYFLKFFCIYFGIF